MTHVAEDQEQAVAESAPATRARPTLSVLIRVRRALPNLRPAEQRVARAVLDDPAAVSESSITTVAKQCNTSETTVLRFCRAIGLAGYPELRIALARAAQWEESDHAGAPITGQISATDPLSDVVAKITHADANAIQDTARALDLDVLQKAVDAVVAARRVNIIGAGASALVGQDLHQKLHRIGMISFVWADPHVSLSSAALLTEADVAIGISHTGTTIDTIDALRVARRRGATTIAITNFDGSPISEEADLLLVTAARETTFRSGAMSSRIAQLALVDCLFAGVAQRSYDSAVEALESTFAAVQSRRSGRRKR
ncbi:DNA-binding MurR/RpiR family transcriptional regulator [Friedmanniella endophytica]|uniref:DNA-binding MurR/RpiR family transcriptional regulator n=1 Tax=Microlunatus kandeliicorticis TaxID=1759536 RepID=A0A7W3P754_9ACTN|nr:MurR/RpiR family transcriptional regulator [Microlunatus kandeliicorticis]MBA8795674.1 DNA-binding MurR/RpiR family transcriptional regulator [Microlunatus kandeliicorticis]